MFRRVLVANRGEIACRIQRTCRRLGIATVAVHSTADAGARHVALADRAIEIGPAPAADSYLAGDRIIAAAQATGAEAIHPGYGFLAENAGFAEAVAAAGLVFVGPTPAAIRAMGAKDEAKRLMHAAGVPCVPGYQGLDGSDDRLRAEAERIGYPLLVKAAAGGGGKGMRVVEQASALGAALEACRSEARRAFGDERLLLERYLVGARHIEAQVLADQHGRTLFLFERECTLQRRHQKVIEEAPSPSLDAAARNRLGAAAVRAAAAVGYRNAGTVEFLHADGEPYFIEMNTRLQVEHPVTEMVTGLDLVEWQLRIAAGEALPWRQEDLRLDGHAMEARLYAEDPAAGFLPATGRLHVVRWPVPAADLRVETGIGTGDIVGLDYDPMLAKLVAHGADRATALARLDAALAATRLVGVTTNRSYLRAVLADPAVAANAVDTTWLERTAFPPAAGVEQDAELLAVADRLLERAERARHQAATAGDPGSPWQAIDGFRLGEPASQPVRLGREAEVIDYTVTANGGGWRLQRGTTSVRLTMALVADELSATVDGRSLRGIVVRDGEVRHVSLPEGDVRFRHVGAVGSGADESTVAGALRAPMPGRILEVGVTPGARVERGMLLVKLEAMKMEHRVTAAVAGTVRSVAIAAGQQVTAGDVLVEIEADEVGP